MACLVVTDTLTGLLDQSSYILWRIFQLLVLRTSETAENLHFNFMSLPWTLHAFIQCGLLLRDLSPSNVRRTTQTVSHRKITIALIAVWIIAFVCRMFEALEMYLIFYSEGIFVNPFRCVCICDFTSWNVSTSKEDKSTKTAPRGGGNIYQWRRGDYDICVCNWCCYCLPSSSLFVSHHFSDRPL